MYELGFYHNKFQINISLGNLNRVAYVTSFLLEFEGCIFKGSVYSKAMYGSEEEGNWRFDSGGEDGAQVDV